MIDVVFKNADFMVVNKPADLNFHSEVDELTGFDFKAETEASAERLGQKAGQEVEHKKVQKTAPGLVVLVKQQQGLEELYPVHRLDKMTSGLVVFALNKATAQAFQRMFESHQIQKFYLAIADKKPKKKQGWIIGDMQSARRGSWKLAKSKEHPAKTQFLSFFIEPGLRLYLVKPITGKTHQIRVALKSIGAPILGDKRYAEANKAKQMDRGYLHAFAIQFEFNDQLYQFVQVPDSGEAFLKPNCQSLIQTWQTPWALF